MNGLITEQKISEVAEKIAKEYQPEKIILFGSYAWGKPTEDSDIDFFILKETDLPLPKRIEAVDRIFSRREFPMDFLVYTPEQTEKSVNEHKNLFIEDILRHGKILYSNSKSAFTINLPKRPLTILH